MASAELIVVFGTWAAAVFAAVVLFGRKGTWFHRWTGRGYAGAIAIVALGALGMQDGRTSYAAMTVAALFSVTAVLFGAYAMRSAMAFERRIWLHSHAMVLSIIALAVVIAAHSADAVNAPTGLVASGVAILGIVVLALSPMRRVLRRFTNEE